MVQLVKTPILDFVDAADLFLRTMHEHITAHVEGDRLRRVQLFDEAGAINVRVGSLCLAARQVGYHLTNFDPSEVERRCHALAEVCSEILRTKTAYHEEDTRRDDPYLRLSGASDPYYSARNAVMELAVAVRPELWKDWPFQLSEKLETVQSESLPLSIEWSSPLQVNQLARYFGYPPKLMGKVLRENKIRNCRISRQSDMVDLAMIPAAYREKWREKTQAKSGQLRPTGDKSDKIAP